MNKFYAFYAGNGQVEIAEITADDRKAAMDKAGEIATKNGWICHSVGTMQHWEGYE